MATILPEHILKLVSPEDRKALGKWGLTSAEAQAKWQARNEKDLQRDVANVLHLKGIEVFSQRMDKRTRGKIGQPDFLFAANGHPCAVELKHGNGQLSEQQAMMLQRLEAPPNQWHCAVIRSVDEMLKFLIELDL